MERTFDKSRPPASPQDVPMESWTVARANRVEAFMVLGFLAFTAALVAPAIVPHEARMMVELACLSSGFTMFGLSLKTLIFG